MPDPTPTTMQQLQEDSLTMIANVSRILRQAIGAALPVAPEQYVTIAIPGTVIDLTDVEQGGTFVWDITNNAFPPTAVRQAEANLVDTMMPISNVMIGNTGKSVARSYSRALDGLLPRKATVSTGDQIRSPGEVYYDNAMKYLTTKDPATGLTPVDVYIEKQKAWGFAQSEWNAAKINAQRVAVDTYPKGSSDDYIAKQTQYFNDWNQQNYQRYKTSVQGRYMDWVTNGHKYDVEYSFGMVDVDSIMERIEASKESMRNSVLVDADGANEVYEVSLVPKNWATYCKLMAEGWYDQYGQYTLSQIEAELDRLNQLLATYKQLATMTSGTTRSYPIPSSTTPPATTLDTQNGLVSTAIMNVYTARAAITAAKFEGKDPTPDQLTTLATDQKALADAEQKLKDLTVEWNEYNIATLSGTAGASVSNWISSTEATIGQQITALTTLLNQKAKTDPVTLPVIVGATQPSTDDPSQPTGEVLAPPGAEYANSIFGIDKTGNIISTTAPAANADQANPWTSISFSYSAADQAMSASQSSWGMSVGGSVGYGLWSVGGNYSHDESKSDMQSDMAKCDVSISFSCMVVNITRPWLYGELFSDFDLDVAQDVLLSPGAAQLQAMIKDQNPTAMASYSEFPAYPTSFIVAANTVIEFTGATSHIEEHFSSSSNSGGVSVGYGPWSVSSSFHSSSANQSTQMHTTASGCKIMFGAPQVIGFVSQILPELPRSDLFNPLTQGASIPIPDGSDPVS